ncbi:MAG TPA: EamA family transporter [Opitutaceae bacterium]
MLLLLFVSFVWAFSFGLIKGRLAGLDPAAVGAVRLAFALLVFLPFFRPAKLTRRALWGLALLGAVQFGVMYVLYLRAFAHLQAFEVALFTIFTPLYVTLIDAALARRFEARHILAAVLSVAGAGAVLWQAKVGGDVLTGFVLMQLSNLCFAAGQVAYKRVRPKLGAAVTDAELFAVLFIGALAATVIASAWSTEWTAFRPDLEQWAVLAYLGVLSSGICFFAWNLGATRVNTGTLAAFNNAKVPLAVACSLVFFGESANVPRLLASLALLGAAVWVAEKR